MLGASMGYWLDLGAAVTSLAAAGFWFFSAARRLPPMVAHYDQTPASDPFYSAVRFSAVMNKWAALLSSLSALCMGLKLFV
jgi:hypothetical protein